jgi:hypothetical protein
MANPTSDEDAADLAGDGTVRRRDDLAEPFAIFADGKAPAGRGGSVASGDEPGLDSGQTAARSQSIVPGQDQAASDHNAIDVGAEIVARAEENLRRAAAERAAAAAERAAAAAERAAAAVDRVEAAVDRERAADDRAQARMDHEALLQLVVLERGLDRDTNH